MKKLFAVLLALLMLGLTACVPDEVAFVDVMVVPNGSTAGEEFVEPEPLPSYLPEEGGYYYDLENVVLYLELYGDLPDNYITKSEARDLGWSGGTVEDYLAGAAIGGDYFGNREGLLPEDDYTECDLNTDGGAPRGAERLVFSDGGEYYYTPDHYKTFIEYTVTEDWEVVEK